MPCSGTFPAVDCILSSRPVVCKIFCLFSSAMLLLLFWDRIRYGYTIQLFFARARVYARTIICTGNIQETRYCQLFFPPSIHWDSIPAYVLQYVLSANLRCSWQPLTMHCEKAYITVSLAFKTGKIIKLRDEWKNVSTNDKKFIGSSMPFHCVQNWFTYFFHNLPKSFILF